MKAAHILTAVILHNVANSGSSTVTRKMKARKCFEVIRAKRQFKGNPRQGKAARSAGQWPNVMNQHD